jgi:hypothetical protein
MSDTTPLSVEAPVDNVETPQEPTPMTTTEWTPEETLTPTPESILSDADLDAIIASLDSVPTVESTSTPSPATPDTMPADTLMESIDQLIGQLDLEEAKTTELNQMIADIDTLYGNIENLIGKDVAEKLALGDTENVPLHYIPDNWKRIEEDTILGPLVVAKLKWESIDIPNFLRDIAKSRMSQATHSAQANPPTPPTPVKPLSPMDEVLKMRTKF